MTLSSCFCCANTLKLEDLIDINTKSLLIGSQTREFSDLLLDVCFVKIDTSEDCYICCSCKDQLVNFHIFKRNVKGYSDFESCIRKIEIFLRLEAELDGADECDKWRVAKYNYNKILIAPQEAHFERFPHSLAEDEAEAVRETLPEAEPPIPSTPSQPKPSTPLQPLIRKKRKIETPLKPLDYKNKSLRKASVMQDPEVKPATNNWNTNSNLTEEQKVWIQENALKGRVRDGTATSWKCSMCGSSQSSAVVLRKHLRDVHIINPAEKSAEKGRGKDFMEQVRSSKTVVDGVAEWKCKQCETALKSESGFIKHLLYSHIKNTQIDPRFIAECKIEIEYDGNKASECGWRCPECGKFFKRSTGLRNHLKLGHSGIDFGGDNYALKLKEAAQRSRMLKEAEKQCEIILETESGPKRIWQCQRCKEQRYFRSESGFKSHIFNCHLKPKRIREDKIAKCKEIFNGQQVWRCTECAMVVTTKIEFVSHAIQQHPGVFDSDNEMSTNDSLPKPQPDEMVLMKLAEQVATDRRRGGMLKVEGYKFSCSECGLFFGKHFPTHVEAHKTFKQLALTYRLPKCEQCHVIYCTEEAITEHNCEALEAFPMKGLAYFGGKEFKQPTGTADDAVDDSIWRCGHCLASFWDENECLQHQMILHCTTLTCHIDQLTFKGNRGLGLYCAHMKNKHPELFPNLTYPCTYCKREFQSIFDKLKHMKACDNKNLQCDVCGRKFFSKVKLAHHLKIETGVLSYECNICGKRCSDSMDLKLHVVGAHTTDRMYQCTYPHCGKNFKSSAARSSHMETHSEATLKCSFCVAVFKKRVVLASHIKLMHNEAYREECFNEFSCKLCNKSFLRRGNFRHHLKAVHNIIEEIQEN